MGQDDETKPKGFLYDWVNEKKTIERIPCEVLQEVEEDEDQVPCEVYSRIVGYMRPVRNWNKGKKQEFAERQEYDVPEAATLKLSPGAKQSADFRDMRDPRGIYNDLPEVIE